MNTNPLQTVSPIQLKNVWAFLVVLKRKKHMLCLSTQQDDAKNTPSFQGSRK